jgi:hypothetical protein
MNQLDELGIGNWVRGKSFSRKTFASHWKLGIGIAPKVFLEKLWARLGIGNWEWVIGFLKVQLITIVCSTPQSGRIKMKWAH